MEMDNLNFKPNGNGSTQLLMPDSAGSDSEQAEHFTLPGVSKGKKNRNSKKGAYSRLDKPPDWKKDGECCCSLAKAALILVFLLVFFCLAGLGLLYYNLLREMNTLKLKMDNLNTDIHHGNNVETGSAGTSVDFEDLQKRVNSLESSKSYLDTQLKDVRHGKSGMDEISKNLAAVTKQVADLSGEVKLLKESVASAPALESVPAKMKTLTQSVASVQGDLHSVSDLIKGVDDKETALEKGSKAILERLTALENKQTNVDVSSKSNTDTIDTTKPDDSNNGDTTKSDLQGNSRLSDVVSSVKSLNSSLTLAQQDIKLYKMELDHLGNLTEGLRLRMDLYEQTGSTLQDRSTVPDWTSIVSDAVAKALERATNGSSLSPQNSSDGISVSKETVSQLTDQITNITALLLMYKAQTDQLRHDFNLGQRPQDEAVWNATSTDILNNILHTTLNDYKRVYHLDMEKMNSTVESMNLTLMSIESRVNANKEGITGLSTAFQQLAQSSVHNVLLPGPVLLPDNNTSAGVRQSTSLPGASDASRLPSEGGTGNDNGNPLQSGVAGGHVESQYNPQNNDDVAPSGVLNKNVNEGSQDGSVPQGGAGPQITDSQNIWNPQGDNGMYNDGAVEHDKKVDDGYPNGGRPQGETGLNTGTLGEGGVDLTGSNHDGVDSSVSNPGSKIVEDAGKTTPSVEVTTRKIVHFWNYDNAKALEIGHSRWDINGDGKVDPADLKQFFGPNITDEDLENYRKFDLDNDGLLSLDETLMAAGFKTTDSTPITEKNSGS